MIQPSSPRNSLSQVRRLVAGLSAGLALTVLPGVSPWAGANGAHLDGQVLRAMSQGERVRVIMIARGDLNLLDADLRPEGGDRGRP